MKKIIFFNHASFAVESEESILIVDPWFEGLAFNNGWSLLDKSTSDDLVISYLSKSNKKIFIWYSHEHSDHFSVSFLKKIKSSNLKVSIFFQKTLDGRVVKFLKKQCFEVIECYDGKTIQLDSNFQITTWPHSDGDSFCLIEVNNFSILNLNDCIFDSLKKLSFLHNKFKEKASSIDILFTQFGYANWAGNEEDYIMRKEIAKEKIQRIQLQGNFLKPRAIVLFASFVYFCQKDNFYLNDAQNTPVSIREYESSSPINTPTYFLKPWDIISLSNSEQLNNDLVLLSEKAENHWNILAKSSLPINNESLISIDKEVLKKAFNKFKKKMLLNFLFIPKIFEFCKVIRPLKVFINDLNIVVQISYIKGMSFSKSNKNWDISMKSSTMLFMITNDYGFNTTNVNGRYRYKNVNEHINFFKFFGPQEYFKNGFGLYHPISSIKSLFSLFLRILRYKKKY